MVQQPRARHRQKNENVFVVRFLEMGCSCPARSRMQRRVGAAWRQRRLVSPALRGSVTLAVGEENEGASPVILHEGEGLRDVPHHEKQDGTASAHGSPRREGWQRRGIDAAACQWMEWGVVGPVSFTELRGCLRTHSRGRSGSGASYHRRAVRKRNRGVWRLAVNDRKRLARCGAEKWYGGLLIGAHMKGGKMAARAVAAHGHRRGSYDERTCVNALQMRRTLTD
jgi:hypothetical protein